MPSIEEKVKEEIAIQLGVKESILNRDATLEGDLGADSLDLVELVIDLESAFGIGISDEDAENLKTVGDVIDYIKDHVE